MLPGPAAGPRRPVGGSWRSVGLGCGFGSVEGAPSPAWPEDCCRAGPPVAPGRLPHLDADVEPPGVDVRLARPPRGLGGRYLTFLVSPGAKVLRRVLAL